MSEQNQAARRRKRKPRVLPLVLLVAASTLR